MNEHVIITERHVTEQNEIRFFVASVFAGELAVTCWLKGEERKPEMMGPMPFLRAVELAMFIRDQWFFRGVREESKWDLSLDCIVPTGIRAGI